MPSKNLDVEILVHVTAPSRSSDDRVWRQLAQSYVNFRPKLRKRVLVAQLPQDDEDATVNPGNEGAVSEAKEDEYGEISQQNSHVVSLPLVSSSQEYSTAFQAHLDKEPAIPFDSQDLSFRSAVDNLGSPALDNMTTVELRLQDSQMCGDASEGARNAHFQSSWVAPASEIGDSYPMADTSLLSASPTDLLERYLGRPAVHRAIEEMSPTKKMTERISSKSANNVVEVPSSQPEETARTLTSGPPEFGLVPLSVDDEVIPDTAPRSTYHIDLEYVSSSLIDSISPDAELPQHREGAQCDEVVDFHDITHISNSSIGGNADAHAKGSRPVSASPKRKQPEDHAEQEDRTFSQVGDIRTTNLQDQTSQGPNSLNKKRKHKRSESNSSTITSDLSKSLSKELPIPSPAAIDRWEAISSSPPVSIDDIHPDDLIPPKLAKLANDLSTRYRPRSHDPVEPLDRGYWLFDCSHFSEEIREKTWTFLARYIRSGLAGWGVWSRWAEDRKSIKVFCWGYVIKHVYLLVYLASERALKGAGAVWIGSDSVVKVDMAPTSRQASALTALD